MLRARTTDGTAILGLDAENVRRLQAGQPIQVNLEQMGGAQTVLIVYGQTVHDIARDLEQASGAPLPPAQALQAELDHAAPSPTLKRLAPTATMTARDIAEATGIPLHTDEKGMEYIKSEDLPPEGVPVGQPQPSLPFETCEDCKHLIGRGTFRWNCRRLGGSCWVQRNKGQCGPSAVFFEPLDLPPACTVEANGGARCAVECCYPVTCGATPGAKEPTP